MQTPVIGDAIKSDMANGTVAISATAPPVAASLTERFPVSMSFDPTTDEGAMLLFKATLHKAKSIKENANRTLTVCNVLTHGASSEKDGGEVQEWKRTVIIDEKGEAWDCGSMGVDKTLSIIKLAFGPPPYKPGIDCEIRLEDMGGGKQWLSLLPVESSVKAFLAARKKKK